MLQAPQCMITFFLVGAFGLSTEGLSSHHHHVESRSALTQFQPAPALPVPEVRHYKAPFQGYRLGSPLYAKQQEWKKLQHGKEVVSWEGMPPVSTTMKCVVSLTVQFFLVYTAHFVMDTLNRLQLVDWNKVTHAAQLKETVHFVPMLCILFVAARMHAVHISQGKTEAYSLPQWWVKTAMVVCSTSVLLQTVLALVYSIVLGVSWDQVSSAVARPRMIERVLAICRHIVAIGIHAGFAVVCVGICVMTPPKELWGEGVSPRVSPAAACTIFLTVLYFAVYIALAASKFVNEAGLLGGQLRFGHGQEPLKVTAATLSSAPMLCVLFLAVRMRALQLETLYDIPQQSWAQTCMYMCTFSVVVQTLLVVIGNMMGVQQKENQYGQIVSTGGTGAVGKIIEGFRWIAILILYGGVVAIIVSIFAVVMPSSDGKKSTITMDTSVSVTLWCIMFLSVLYWLVYLAMWLVISIEVLVGRSGKTSKDAKEVPSSLRAWLTGDVRDSVAFCPMLAVLFLGVRMRALQITQNKGHPQGWCLAVMGCATWAVLFQSIARIDRLFVGTSTDRISGSSIDPKGAGAKSEPLISKLCEVVRYLCLLVMYAAVVAVIIALFTMTPASAGAP